MSQCLSKPHRQTFSVHISTVHGVGHLTPFQQKGRQQLRSEYVYSYNSFAFRFTNLNGTEDPTAPRFPSTAVTRVRLSLVCLCLRLFVVFLQHNISKRKTMGPLCFHTRQNQTATYIESNPIESNRIESTLTAYNSAVTSSSHTLESWILGRCFPCHHLPLDSL